MSKTIIIDENILKSGVLNEAIEFNQLPNNLRTDIETGKNPLSNNRCFPYDGYFEKGLIAAFKKAASKEPVVNGYATPSNISQIEVQCQKIEKPNKNNLETLISKVVMELFSIPADKVDFSVELVDSIDQSDTTVPFGPNEQAPVGVRNIDSLGVLDSEISKRAFQNSLIAGASLYYTRKILSEISSSLDEINPQLYDLYNDYLTINDYLIYLDGEQITEEDKHETGRVIVTLGNDEVKNKLEAKGTIFPVLLYETIKGFLEMFASHGLPDDDELANTVVSKTDYLLAEPWYMRFGKVSWGRFIVGLKHIGKEKEARLIPYILMKLSKLGADKYNKVMQEILSGTERSRKILERVCEYAERKCNKNEFDTRMSNTRAQSVDQDAYMITDDELNEDILKEGISDITYHFCTIKQCNNILQKDTFFLTMSSNRADAYDNKRLFYLSTQRGRSKDLGYAQANHITARIQLDGAKLSQQYKGAPIDYWGSMGKQSYYNPIYDSSYGQGLTNTRKQHRNFEMEDRVFSYEPYIENASKYITRIDVLVDRDGNPEYTKNDRYDAISTYILCSDMRIPFYCYDNKQDFNQMTDNTINSEIEEMYNNSYDINYGERERGDMGFSRLSKERRIVFNETMVLCNLINVLHGGYLYQDKDVYKFISNVLKKYGLENTSNKVMKMIPKYWRDSFEESCRAVSGPIRRLNTEYGSDNANKIMMLGADILRQNRVNNFDTLGKRY